jgi:hypothetical protein
MAHSKEYVEREEAALAQQVYVAADWLAHGELAILVGGFKRTVILCDPFAEPNRKARTVSVNW